MGKSSGESRLCRATGHSLPRGGARSAPESPRYRDYLWEDYVHESPILLGRAKIERDVPTRRRLIEDAAKDADRLVGILPDDADSYVQAATFLVKCGQTAGDQGRDYLDRAMKVLKKGVAIAVIREPADLDYRTLDVLKSREDFQKLRQSLKPRSRRLIRRA